MFICFLGFRVKGLGGLFAFFFGCFIGLCVLFWNWYLGWGWGEVGLLVAIRGNTRLRFLFDFCIVLRLRLYLFSKLLVGLILIYSFDSLIAFYLVNYSLCLPNNHYLNLLIIKISIHHILLTLHVVENARLMG
jgi:hypothetical protein